MTYKVTPILAGEIGPVAENVRFAGGDPSKGEMVPSLVYHVISDEHNILVDMSFSSVEKCKELMPGLTFKRDGSFAEILKSHGVIPEQIDTVICTHLHWDHAGNGNLFPSAKIVCQRDELASAVAPHPWEQGYRRAFSNEVIEVLDRVYTIEGDTLLYEGIELKKIGGHSPGSQAVVVTTENGKVIIPGDNIMSYENLEKSMAVGLFVNLDQCVAGLQWARLQNAKVLPGHDWKTLK